LPRLAGLGLQLQPGLQVALSGRPVLAGLCHRGHPGQGLAAEDPRSLDVPLTGANERKRVLEVEPRVAQPAITQGNRAECQVDLGVLGGLDGRLLQRTTAQPGLAGAEEQSRQDQLGWRPFGMLGGLLLDQAQRLIVPALADLQRGRLQLLAGGFGHLACRLTQATRSRPGRRGRVPHEGRHAEADDPSLACWA
jgi:hypothetical protein